MPSPLGEGQTDTLINRLYLGEVTRTFPAPGLESSSAIWEWLKGWAKISLPQRSQSSLRKSSGFSVVSVAKPTTLSTPRNFP
jgi:hypothetical protein